jgi:hypothetical protein
MAIRRTGNEPEATRKPTPSGNPGAVEGENVWSEKPGLVGGCTQAPMHFCSLPSRPRDEDALISRAGFSMGNCTQAMTDA